MSKNLVILVVKRSKEDLLALKQAIAEKDFTQLGKIAEGNAMCMHALNLSATPHFNYFEAESLKAMQLVEQLRGQGLECLIRITFLPLHKTTIDRATSRTRTTAS